MKGSAWAVSGFFASLLLNVLVGFFFLIWVTLASMDRPAPGLGLRVVLVLAVLLAANGLVIGIGVIRRWEPFAYGWAVGILGAMLGVPLVMWLIHAL